MPDASLLHECEACGEGYAPRRFTCPKCGHMRSFAKLSILVAVLAAALWFWLLSTGRA